MLVRKIEYLLALAKEGHFARAAASCHVSQPALSAGIHQLEIELGVPIVRRGGQRFAGFTAEGDVVLKWAQRFAEECEDLQHELTHRFGTSRGILRVGVLNSCSALVSDLTIPFEEQYPDVSLRIIAQNPFELQQSIEALSVD